MSYMYLSHKRELTISECSFTIYDYLMIISSRHHLTARYNFYVSHMETAEKVPNVLNVQQKNDKNNLP